MTRGVNKYGLRFTIQGYDMSDNGFEFMTVNHKGFVPNYKRQKKSSEVERPSFYVIWSKFD